MTRRTKRLLTFVALAGGIVSAQFASAVMVTLAIRWWPQWLIGIITGMAFVRIWMMGRQDGIEFGDLDGGWVDEKREAK
jgi:uncharacterized membrane protein